MNTLLNDNDEDVEDHHRAHAGHKPDREITLGTTVVLGIFFALAVFGAVMFGFGYSVGVKHINSATAAAQADPNATFNGFKPPSGKTDGDLAKPAAASVTVPLTTPPVLPKALPKPAPDQVPSVEAEVTPVPVRPVPAAPVTRPIAAPGAPLVAPSTGQIMVQIAAISAAHQDDAESVLTSLKRKGYTVSIRHEPADQLLHVQVGPFTTRKDADAMRQRIQADGFNAIVKDPTH